MRAQPRLQSLSPSLSLEGERERERESLGTKLMRAFSQVIFGMVPISFAVYVSVTTRVAWMCSCKLQMHVKPLVLST